jgi:hypothetical protein
MKELKDFLYFNRLDSNVAFADDDDTNEIKEFVESDYPSLLPVFEKIGGHSFENGLFRIHTFGSSANWSNLLREYFPECGFNFYCFGYDWMGCMYCFSLDDEPIVYIFDPADMETREAEATIELFFNVDLVKNRDETLLYKRFNTLRKRFKLEVLAVDKCIGYEESLFLGGEDKDSNFAIADLEVYWELQSKIYRKIKDLPDGAEIGDINFEE